MEVKVAPSLLAADFTRLADEIRRVEKAGCDMLHVDVMDGHFVPNITVGPFIVEAIRKLTRLPLDVHLMIETPWEFIEPFASAGANHITVHQEACPENLSRVLSKMRSFHVTRGVSLKPETPVKAILGHLSEIDMVLLMTVNPGFGGQSFMPEVVPKIRELRSLYSGYIEVDGGINVETARVAREAGANVLVAGTAIFGNPDAGKIISQMRA